MWRPYNLALFVFVPMVFSVFIAYQNIIESVDSTGIYVENISDEKFYSKKPKTCVRACKGNPELEIVHLTHDPI